MDVPTRGESDYVQEKEGRVVKHRPGLYVREGEARGNGETRGATTRKDGGPGSKTQRAVGEDSTSRARAAARVNTRKVSRLRPKVVSGEKAPGSQRESERNSSVNR